MSGATLVGRVKLRTIRAYSLIIVVSLVAAALLPLLATKQAKAWSLDPTMNTPICTAQRDQTSPALIGDGSGGAIIVWIDQRSYRHSIFVQRVDASGQALWALNGLAVCSGTSDQVYPSLTSDGAGGAIVAWQDCRGGNYDVYVQRVNSSGAPLWTDGGVALCTAVGDQAHPVLIDDGSGGAVVVWEDHRTGAFGDIYAQRVSASGAPLWTDGGVAVCTAQRQQANPCLATDGCGGAIVAWEDDREHMRFDTYWGGVHRVYEVQNWRVYAQRVSASGQSMWTLDGVALGNFFGKEVNPDVIADGSGGAFIAWNDYRSGNCNIYAQRLDSSGASQWTGGGLSMCSSTSDHILTCMVGDGLGGVFITWEDQRPSTNCDIYAQKVDPSGKQDWTDKGMAICTGPGGRGLPYAVADGCGGTIIAWTDSRSGNLDIYAQRVNPSGNSLWTDNGMAISCSAGDQVGPCMIGNGSGGAIVAWMDYRRGDYDIYAQRVNGLGEPGAPPYQPSNISPTNCACDVSLTPTLESSAFSDPDSGDSHWASQWRIGSVARDYSSPIFDSGTDNANLIQLTVPSGRLRSNTTYYWQVRYEDSRGDWSAWSEESSFTTLEESPSTTEEESSTIAQSSSRTWIWIVVGVAALIILAGGIGIWRLRSARKSSPS